MKFSKMQAIEYMLREIEDNYGIKRKHLLVIKMDNEFWTTSFLKKYPTIEGYFTSRSTITERGTVQYTEINVSDHGNDIWAAITDFRNKFFTEQNYNKYAKFIQNCTDSQVLFETLTNLSEDLTQKNDLPKYLYDLKKLGEENVTLPFLHIDEKDFEWVSIIIEDLK